MLDIIDKPGLPTKLEMMDEFEKAVLSSPLKDSTPLGTMTINGKVSHYMDSDTDALWMGFAMGYRIAFRIERNRTNTMEQQMLNHTM